MTHSFSYIPRKSAVHSLTGATKLYAFVLWSLGTMLTYDTRVLAGMLLLSLGAFFLSHIRFREICFAFCFILFFLLLNDATIFFFSPEQGVAVYGTRHQIAHFFGSYDLTQEQLFYLLNVSLKYFAMVPVALLFFATTDPSEFASSLSRVGISYRVGYAVALALRYIPDILEEFRSISHAQEARGLSISRDVKFSNRVKNAAAILLPLVLSSLSRIETISNAMELRGFGKNKKRTWYVSRPFAAGDFAAIGFVTVVVALSFAVTLHNGSRFFNPFR